MFQKASLCLVYGKVSTLKRASLKLMCKSAEMKHVLTVAHALCGAKKPIATKKPGSGSGGAKKPMTTKKATPSKMCAEASQMVGVFYAYVCDYVYVRVRVRAREESQQQKYAPA